MENIQKKAAYRLFTLITTPKLAEEAADIFKQVQSPLQYRFNAQGTASSEIMDMLGLGSIDKCVLMSLLPKELADSMLKKLKAELQMHAVNSGIAFTVPLSGINNLILRILTQNAEDSGLSSEGKDKVEMAEMKHALIVAITDRGFSGDVMEAAKSVGAKGGTVIHSRRIANDEATGFWGLSMQEEKEIVMIIAEAADKIPIMQSIGERCGMHSKAKGIVMSLPIDTVTGI